MYRHLGYYTELSLKNKADILTLFGLIWYNFKTEVLLNLCQGEYDGYDDPKNIISEQIIQSFNYQ